MTEIQQKCAKNYIKKRLKTDKPNSPNNGKSFNLLWRFCCLQHLDFALIRCRLSNQGVNNDAEFIAE